MIVLNLALFSQGRMTASCIFMFGQQVIRLLISALDKILQFIRAG